MWQNCVTRSCRKDWAQIGAWPGDWILQTRLQKDLLLSQFLDLLLFVERLTLNTDFPCVLDADDWNYARWDIIRTSGRFVISIVIDVYYLRIWKFCKFRLPRTTLESSPVSLTTDWPGYNYWWNETVECFGSSRELHETFKLGTQSCCLRGR